MSENLMKDLESIKESMDTSNLFPEHQMHDTMNEGKLFKLKLETASHEIQGFVGLGAKSYALLVSSFI